MDTRFLDKEANNTQWIRESIFYRWCWSKWISACRRVQINPYLSHYPKLIQWIKGFLYSQNFSILLFSDLTLFIFYSLFHLDVISSFCSKDFSCAVKLLVRDLSMFKNVGTQSQELDSQNYFQLLIYILKFGRIVHSFLFHSRKYMMFL